MSAAVRTALLAACGAAALAGCYDTAPPAPKQVPRIFALEENNKAVAALFEGRLEEALAHAAAAVEDDPGFVAARVNKANILAQLQRFDEAAAVLEHAAPDNSEIASAHLFRGIFLEKAARETEARAAFAQAAAAYDGALAAGRSDPESMVNRAVAQFMARGQTQGLMAINDALAQYPDFHRANFTRDRILDNDRSYFIRWLSEPAAAGAPNATE